MNNNNNPKVNKLNRLDILALVVGSIIGWGSFTLPGFKFLPESGLLSTLIAFSLGGLAVIFIQAAYHQMLIEHNEDGGEFSYTFRHLGQRHGFIVGWSLTLAYLSMMPLNATAFVQIFRLVLGDKFDLVYLYSIAGTDIYLTDVLLASFILLVFMAINLRGIKASALVQRTLSLALVGIVIVLSILMYRKADLFSFRANYLGPGQITFSGIAQVLAIAPFLFVGFDVIPQVITELKFSRRKASLYAVVGILFGVLVYSLLSSMTALVYAPLEASRKTWALGEAVLSKLGYLGFMPLVLALFAAVSAGINGFLIAATRLFSALAEYGFIPQRYAQKNRYNIRANAVYFVTTVSLIAPWFGRPVIGYIVDMSSLLAAVAYFYVCLITIRKTQGIKRFFVLLGLLMSISFMLLLLLPQSPAALSKEAVIFLVAWVILGLIYYLLYSRRKRV